MHDDTGSAATEVRSLLQITTVRVSCGKKCSAWMLQRAPVAMQVTICGIGENAFLLGRDDSGNVCELHYHTNSLDLMQGMIKRKQ